MGLEADLLLGIHHRDRQVTAKLKIERSVPRQLDFLTFGGDKRSAAARQDAHQHALLAAEASPSRRGIPIS